MLSDYKMEVHQEDLSQLRVQAEASCPPVTDDGEGLLHSTDYGTRSPRCTRS